MANRPMQQVLEQLREAVHEATDAELLHAYRHKHDPQSLAILVRRYGPMVWHVCRRVLTNTDDADDAMQATFLVFMRKLSTLTPERGLGPWLYRVAYRTALNVRQANALRQRREKARAEPPEIAVPPVEWDDQHRVLDEELMRLPGHYRTVVLLADVQGRTRKEIAQLLQWPEGTVAGRLARAHVMLARRLTRRGIVLGVAGSVGGWIARGSGHGQEATSNIERIVSQQWSPNATVVAEGVIQTMRQTKIAIIIGVCAVVGGLIGSSVVVAQQFKTSEQQEPPTTITREEQNPEAKANKPPAFEPPSPLTASRSDGSQITFFAVPAQPAFQPKDGTLSKLRRALDSVAVNSSALWNDRVAVARQHAHQRFKRAGNDVPFTDCYVVLVYPKEGLLTTNAGQKPTATFAPGKLTTLKAALDQWGPSTHHERWHGPSSDALRCAGDILWWDDHGVRADEHGAITHVLIRNPIHRSEKNERLVHDCDARRGVPRTLTMKATDSFLATYKIKTNNIEAVKVRSNHLDVSVTVGHWNDLVEITIQTENKRPAKATIYWEITEFTGHTHSARIELVWE